MDSPQPARRYLDHPAASWPKPPEVIDAILRAIREVGGAAGRGTHAAAREAGAIRAAARAGAARLVGGGTPPSRVALLPGATLGLNVAIQGLVRPGWRVIATAADHNATLRPLHRLARAGVIDLAIVPCDGVGRVDPDDVAAAWGPGAAMVVFSHASNVTGTVQDAAAIVGLARRNGAVSVVDAAQTAGIVDLPAADILVAPVHKWLQGPQGLAFLVAREGVEPEPLVQGGTGTASDSLEMPAGFPERLEAGTPDLAALAGFAAAAAWLERHSPREVAAHGRRLADACREALRSVAAVRVVGGGGEGPPIVAFTVDGYDPAEVATLLEQIAGVQARAGLHCAALVHGHLASGPRGVVRLGFGPFNTPADVGAAVEAVCRIVGAPAASVDLSPFPQAPPWQE